MRRNLGIDMEDAAMRFAMSMHFNQKRKYTGEQYIVHPAEVVEIVRTVPHTSEMIQAAWLHDVVEDCGVDIKLIGKVFGDKVESLVEMLTDVSTVKDDNRAARKLIDLQHTSKASPEAKTIKLADLISNTSSIMEHDKKFAKTYLIEKRALLEVLREGNQDLWRAAYNIAYDNL